MECLLIKSLQLKKTRVNKSFERFNVKLSNNYNNAGVFYDNQGNTKQAEIYYAKEREIRKQMAKNNP